MRSADRLTGTGISVGTPSYMSPEQATGEREIDARSDVYSLASVVYEMLAGEAPYSGANARAILAKQLADPVRPVRRLRDGVPKHVDDALAVALGRAPADRFPDMASFAAALEASGPAPARDGPIITGDDTPVRTPGRRRLARVAAAVVVLGGGVATWATLMRPRPALGMPSVRIERFTTAAGDTASAYLAATLKQDVTAALAGSHAARVFVMDSARLSSGYAVSATAARTSDSVEVALSVTVEPTGEFKGKRVVRRPLGRAHELPEAATDAILTIVGLSRRGLTIGTSANDGLHRVRPVSSRALPDRPAHGGVHPAGRRALPPGGPARLQLRGGMGRPCARVAAGETPALSRPGHSRR